MNEITVDATPDKSLIKKLGMVGYKTEQAIAELIDNSIDARIDNSRLNIEITFDYRKHEIIVKDEGCGMEPKELQDAWTIAKSSNDSQRKLGKFGMGMKSACSALGSVFIISTTTKGSDKELVLEYDEVQWLKDKDANWSNIRIEQHDTEKHTHGTTIHISKPHVPMYPSQEKNFMTRFSTRYGPYISRDKIRIRINDNECTAIEPEIREGTRKDIELHTLEGFVIKGWIGLLKKRSIKGDYGIHLYREGRLIELYAKFGIPTHPSAARIIGELHLDYVPVDVFKMNFFEESDEYKHALEVFKMDPIVKKTLKLAAEYNDKTDDYESILNLQNPEHAPRISRLGDSSVEKMLKKFESITINTKSGKMIMSLDDLDSGIYDVKRRGDVTQIIVNRNSGAFKAFRNPLFFLMMLRLEVEEASTNTDILEFVHRRNEQWEKYISKLAGTRTNKISMSHLQANSTSYDLDVLRERLTNDFPRNFQFTAMFTLENFLRYAHNKVVYTIYTEEGAGKTLEEILNEYGEYVILFEPNKFQLESTLNMISHKKFIVIRQYASIPTSNIASLDKSWVDLYFEVTRKGLSLYESDLGMINYLISNKLVSKEKINSYAKRRGIEKNIIKYIGE